MNVTRRVAVILAAGVLGWGGATGIAVAAVAGVGPQGETGTQGVAGAPGVNGKDGADGTDNTVAGPRGPVGPQGAAGATGPRGAAYKASTHTVFSRSGTGDYNGRVTTAEPDVEMTVTYSYDCDSYSPFMVISWNGSPSFDYESLWIEDGASTSGTQYMNPSVSRGSFKIGTQDDCSWSVKVTQNY
jgi:hypothetical protein